MEEQMPFQSSFPIPNFNRIAFAAWEVKNLERNSTVHLSGEIQTQVKQHQCCKIELIRICACTGNVPGPDTNASTLRVSASAEPWEPEGVIP